MTSLTTLSWTRKEELTKLRDTFHSKEIQTCNRNTVQITIAASTYRRATIRCHMRDNYPEKKVIIELDAPLLASGVQKKLLKACESRVTQCAVSNDMQVFNTVSYLKEIIHSNLLLSCVDEVKKQTKNAGNKDSICTNVAMSEKTGLVRLDFKNGKYEMTMDIKVPENYPSSQPKIIFRRSTFPKSINEVFHAQTCEIARRLVLGLSEEQALNASDGLKRPPQKKRVKDPLGKVRIDTDKIHQLNNDVKVLKRMSELRKESKMNHKKKNQYKQQRNQKALNEGNQAARNARKELRNLVKNETKKEDQWQLDEARMNAIEEGVLKLNASERAIIRPIGIVINFVTNKFVQRIPAAICEGCKENLLPEDPNDAKGIFDSKSKQRPRRVYCGHWWHTSCLNQALTLPPFGLQGCPGIGCCGKDVRIWHHEWSRDIRKHEKAWSAKKAREREIQEVAEIFGFSDDDEEEEEEEENEEEGEEEDDDE
mgnify:CR=1 FL=1